MRAVPGRRPRRPVSRRRPRCLKSEQGESGESDRTVNDRNHKRTWLSDAHKELGKKVTRCLGDYIEAPNVERTHNLRVAIRRFLVLTKQLPKKQRSKELRRYRSRCKQFLRLTTKLRDLDIVRERLGRHPQNSAVPPMLDRLEAERRKLAKASVKTARKLRDSRPPAKAVSKADGVWPRIRKSLAEFDEEVPQMLSLVVKSEANVQALHQLKKEVRRYRYLLELLPKGQRESRRAIP